MNELETILAKFDELNDTISERMDGIDSRLDHYEQLLHANIKRTTRQDEAIAGLERKVRELSETSAVWRSSELREVGIDRDTAYDAFRELGYTSRDALKLLEKAGILRRGGSHLTKAVRKGDRVIRAVVIMEE